MRLHSFLDVAGLAIASVYCTIPLFWLVFHPFVERWRQHGRRAYLAIIPIWGIFIGAAFALGWPIRHLHLYDTDMPWIMGVLFIVAGLSIYGSASRGFDRAQVSGLAELELGRHQQEAGCHRDSRPGSSSHLPRTSLRSHGLDTRYRFDCALRLAGICGGHRRNHDSQGRCRA